MDGFTGAYLSGIFKMSCFSSSETSGLSFIPLRIFARIGRGRSNGFFLSVDHWAMSSANGLVKTLLQFTQLFRLSSG